MKIFFYKTLLVFFLIFVLFHLTFGAKLREIEGRLEYFKSKKNIEITKNKIRDELRTAVGKENYLSTEDAQLINKFINKLKQELSSQN